MLGRSEKRYLEESSLSGQSADDDDDEEEEEEEESTGERDEDLALEEIPIRGKRKTPPTADRPLAKIRLKVGQPKSENVVILRTSSTPNKSPTKSNTQGSHEDSTPVVPIMEKPIIRLTNGTPANDSEPPVDTATVVKLDEVASREPSLAPVGLDSLERVKEKVVPPGPRRAPRKKRKWLKKGEGTSGCSWTWQKRSCGYRQRYRFRC